MSHRSISAPRPSAEQIKVEVQLGPGGKGESQLVGRAPLEDIYPGGRAALGLESFGVEGDQNKLFAEANQILAPGARRFNSKFDSRSLSQWEQDFSLNPGQCVRPSKPSTQFFEQSSSMTLIQIATSTLGVGKISGG
ncbi:hypothetical protein C8R46DRAFT_1040050 [Mycena filopes]|nr:hypothetical protein C8R46DRAFT_1040050 [Mycena filopes]